MSVSSLAPQNSLEVASIVRDAAARRQSIEIIGGGSKRALGRPLDAAITVDVSGLSGVTLYEPAELVVSARSGTPLQHVTDLLAQKGQMLPFEPADYRPLLASTGEPTIGGMVATNLSGPRRLHVGACRDAIIGCKFVNGRGEEIVSGGRVMKNVTGYDIGRAMAGAYGTLGVLTEITFKVLPRSHATLTLVYEGLSCDRAVALMSAAVASPFEVTAAAHIAEGNRARTCLRLEGFDASITYRAGRLIEDLAEYGQPQRLDTAPSKALWREIGEARSIIEPADHVVWRLQMPPSRSAALVNSLRAMMDVSVLYDWAGGLVWLSHAPGDDVTAVRTAAKAGGGHATLIRAGEALRRRLSPFEPQAPAVEKLARGLKHAFDPAGILNPGRMYAGI